MKLLIDDAHLDAIKRIYEIYPVDGVTTNPTILAKSGEPPYRILKQIRALIGEKDELHVQVTASEADGMAEDARRIVGEMGEGTFVKVPAVPEGFKAMRKLKEDGYRVTATAVYMPMQAFIAAKCGADYVAPYINRIDNLGADGLDAARVIREILTGGGYRTQVLAASFKNVRQVQELCRFGIDAATVAPDILELFASSAAVDAAVEAFNRDFERLAGKGKTMANCE